MEFKRVRGTVDLYGDDLRIWNYIEDIISKITKTYCIEEIRTPIIEHTNLFVRGVGESSDIVSKEMYSFNDKKGRNICLRPESTAGVARAYVENKIYIDDRVKKFYYIYPCFRYEKPQSGRQRQFHQFGVELFGSNSIYSDVEVILIATTLLNKLNIKNINLELNSIGCVSCRIKYNELLKSFLSENKEKFCSLCENRLEKNPMRVFDCKNENCQKLLDEFPKISDCLCEKCEEDFKSLQYTLDELNIKYLINKKLVRGLDYYTNTVFEFISSDLLAQSTVIAGGRYNNLIKEVGNVDIPAVGFGLGLERLVLILKEQKNELKSNLDKKLFIGSIGNKAKLKAIFLCEKLRGLNISCETDILNKNVKHQMKYANKKQFEYSIIIGDTEIENNKVNIKNMSTKETFEVGLDALTIKDYIIKNN